MPDERSRGIHGGGPRPHGGYRNSAEPEKNPGRKARRARARLQARRDKALNKANGYENPDRGNRIWVRTLGGKVKGHTLPGSNNK